jgi:hypothetical protein
VITSATFGAGGRLGNQLFQVGLLFAVAAKTGHRFGLRRASEEIWQCFDLDIPDLAGPVTNIFKESHGTCNFEPVVFSQPDGTAFDGYYQSCRYYDHCRPELTSFLRFQSRHRDLAELEIERLRSTYRLPVVSLHYRRMDYLDAGSMHVWGNLQADGYYDRVFDRLGDDILYLVFSDDIAWCRENVRRRHVAFADVDPHVSLCMMTLCDINVIANSSFSWWGAFLNQAGRTVIAPSRWFQALPPPPHDCPDMAPPDWIRIETFRTAP